MPKKRIPNFNFNTVTIKGHQYYKAYVQNADGKTIIVYGKTIEDLCQKVDAAQHRSETDEKRLNSPTVKEYAEKWLLMQSANVRATTLIDYTSKVKRHIIAPLGHMKMTDVTADDIKLALVPVSRKSASVFKSVNILYKCIFNSAEDSRIITYNPTRFLSTKGGGVPQKDRESLTDEQVGLLSGVRQTVEEVVGCCDRNRTGADVIHAGHRQIGEHAAGKRHIPGTRTGRRFSRQ